MRKLSQVVVLMLSSLTIMFGQIQYRQSATGLKFFMAIDEQGPTSRLGQLVSMHMSIKDANGTYIKNTFKESKPMMFPVKLTVFDGDIYEAVGLLSKGDSAHFLINADSMYARIFRKPMPENLKKGSMLDVRIRVFDIWDQTERIEELKEHADTVVSATEKARRAKEDLEIQKYIKNLGYQMQKSPKGVYYVFFSEGNGPVTSVNGKTMVINFVGKLLNGTKFETTYNEENIGRPISFVLGKGEVIPGWDDVLLGTNEGDRIVCVVPSHLGFGAMAKGSVLPPNSVLVFELDVMGVR